MNEKVYGVWIINKKKRYSHWCSNSNNQFMDSYGLMLESFNYFVEKGFDDAKHELRKHTLNKQCFRNMPNCCVGLPLDFSKATIKELIKALEL